MIMADILFYFFLVVGMYLAFISYWVMAEALFPKFVEACRVEYESRPVRNALRGLAAGIPLIVAGIALITIMGNPVMQISGIALIITVALVGLIGSAGLCSQIGKGLQNPNDALQPWRSVLRGGAVLGMTFILPVVGWFGVLPFTLISGLGAFVRILLINRSSRRSVGTKNSGDLRT